MQEGIVVILGSSKCLPIGRNWKRALSCGSLEDPGMDEDSVQGSLLCPASREAPRRFESFKDVAPRTVGRLLFVGPTGHTGLDGLFVQTAGKPPEATSNRKKATQGRGSSRKTRTSWRNHQPMVHRPAHISLLGSVMQRWQPLDSPVLHG